MILEAQHISKKYSKRLVVDNLSISIEEGQIVGLLGPNGAGKTTFFYIIAGILNSDSGKVFINEKEITNQKVSQRALRGIAYLPQEPSIFRRLTVKENLMAALEQRNDLQSPERVKELMHLIEEFHLKPFLDTKAVKLSGGERRKVEIARALASKPAFLLLDEPFAGIDPIAVSELKETLYRLKERGIGVLISDHNVREAMNICDKVLIMNQGKNIAEGLPKDIKENNLVKEVYLGKDY